MPANTLSDIITIRNITNDPYFGKALDRGLQNMGAPAPTNAHRRLNF